MNATARNGRSGRAGRCTAIPVIARPIRASAYDITPRTGEASTRENNALISPIPCPAAPRRVLQNNSKAKSMPHMAKAASALRASAFTPPDASAAMAEAAASNTASTFGSRRSRASIAPASSKSAFSTAKATDRAITPLPPDTPYSDAQRTPRSPPTGRIA